MDSISTNENLSRSVKELWRLNNEAEAITASTEVAMDLSDLYPLQKGMDTTTRGINQLVTHTTDGLGSTADKDSLLLWTESLVSSEDKLREVRKRLEATAKQWSPEGQYVIGTMSGYAEHTIDTVVASKIAGIVNNIHGNHGDFLLQESRRLGLIEPPESVEKGVFLANIPPFVVLETNGHLVELPVLNEVEGLKKGDLVTFRADELGVYAVDKELDKGGPAQRDYPALIAGTKDDQGRWYNLTAYADRHNPGQLIGTLQRRDPEKNNFEKTPVAFREANGRLTALATFDTGEKYVAALSPSKPTEKGYVKVDYNVSKMQRDDKGKNQFIKVNKFAGRLRENPALAARVQAAERDIIKQALGIEPKMLKAYDGPAYQAPTKTRGMGKEVGLG